MKLAMMSYIMGVHGFGLDDIIRTAVKCKLDGMDWDARFGTDPFEVKKKSADAGLPIVCYIFFLKKFLSGDPGWIDEAKKEIEYAARLGTPVVMIPTMTSDRLPRGEFRRRWIGALSEIVHLTDKAGITLTVENFPGEHSAFVTADDFLEARKEIPQLRLTFDNGNASSGENPIESFRRCREYVVHAHFKDWHIRDEPTAGYQKMLDGRYYNYALIGEGDIDTAGCWKAMKDAGYRGYINIESDSHDRNFEKAFSRVANLLRGISFRVGIHNRKSGISMGFPPSLGLRNA
jgi:sugar phosphate isomerase/epimerase